MGADALKNLLTDQYPIMYFTDEVAEVAHGNFGVTDSNGQKPIIATSALVTCICLLGCDEKHKIGFLMSIRSSNDVRSGLEKLYEELARRYPNYPTMEFDTYIVASTFSDPQTYGYLKEALRENPSGLGTQLREPSLIEFAPDMGREGQVGEGIALDTRNGKIFAYLIDTSKGQYEPEYNHRIPERRSF